MSQRPKYGKVFKWVLGVIVGLYTCLGSMRCNDAEMPLTTFFSSILSGLLAGSILGGIIVLFMWITRSREPDQSDDSK